MYVIKNFSKTHGKALVSEPLFNKVVGLPGYCLNTAKLIIKLEPKRVVF